MKKNLILLIIICFLPSVMNGAVGNHFYLNGICYTITKEVVVYSSTSYAGGSVKVGLENGWTSNGSGDVTIPSTVKYNGYYYAVEGVLNDAFRNSTTITSIVLPSSIREIGDRAFIGCSSLVSVNLPGSVNALRNSVFEGCTSLESINMNNVRRIYPRAFYGCTNLKEVIFPKDLTSIDSNSFEGCSSLSSITLTADKVTFGTNVFLNCSSLSTVNSYMTDITGLSSVSCFQNISPSCKLFVVNGMKNSYEGSPYWASSFSQILVFRPSVGDVFTAPLLIGDGNEVMEFEVTDEDGLTVYIKSIKEGVISSAVEPIDVEIPECVIDRELSFKIGGVKNSAFENTKIGRLFFNHNLRVIESSGFANCNVLNSASVPWRTPAEIEANENCFNGLPSNAVLYVPAGTKERYEDLTPWNQFSQIIESSPISTGDISARYGSKANLPIFLKNTETISGLQFKLTLPEGVTVVDHESNLVTSTTERTEGFTIMGRKDPDEENSYLFVVLSLNGDAISGTEGAFMNVRLDIAQNVGLGVHDIKIEDVYMTTETFDTLNPAESTSELTVKDFMLGDVNNDGIINITDAIGIINYVLKNTPETFIEGAADVNQDGIINVTDAIGVINKILN